MPRRQVIAIAGALSVLVVVTSAGPARAFVRSRTEMGGIPLQWEKSCVPFTIYVNGFTKNGFTLENIGKSVAAAAHAWSADAVTCPGGGSSHPFLELVPTLSADVRPPAAAFDSRNVVIFRTELWSKSGIQGTGNGYAYDALAVTTVSARGGRIVDADIEVNGVTKTWLDLDPGVQPPPDNHGEVIQVHDLQNALTHEFGHFVGLEHTCFNPQSLKTRPVDDMGDMVPDCDDATPAQRATVMFDSAQPAETSKRTLSDDDKRAVCTIYPAASDPHACDVDRPIDGCAVAGRPGPERPSLLSRVAFPFVAGVTVLALARRRRRA